MHKYSSLAISTTTASCTPQSIRYLLYNHLHSPPYTCVARDPVFLNVPLLGRINCPLLVVVLFDEGLPMAMPDDNWFVMFMLLELLLRFELLVSVLLLLLLIARLELLRLLLLLLVSKLAATMLPGDMPRWFWPWWCCCCCCRVTELYGGGAGVAEGFAVLGGGNGGRALLDCRR